MLLTCPKCGVGETHEDFPGLIMIRAYKVMDNPIDGWWSQCLVCSGFYEKADVIGYHNKQIYVKTPTKHDSTKGWFSEKMSKRFGAKNRARVTIAPIQFPHRQG